LILAILVCFSENFLLSVKLKGKNVESSVDLRRFKIFLEKIDIFIL